MAVVVARFFSSTYFLSIIETYGACLLGCNEASIYEQKELYILLKVQQAGTHKAGIINLLSEIDQIFTAH